MAGYVAVDPPMHGHHRHMHLLMCIRRKKCVEDSGHRNCARSDEEEPRWPLLEKQFLERCKLAESCLLNFGRQPPRKTLELFSDLTKSRMIHVFAPLQL